MTSLVLAACAASGVYLVMTGPAPRTAPTGGDARRRFARGTVRRLRRRLEQSGLEGVSPAQFVGSSLVLGVLAAIPSSIVFGPGVSTLLVALSAALVPAALWRRRREANRRAAREAWPRLIEEIRVMTGSGGRSIPQALIDVGLRGPEEMRGAFRDAQREWALTTDFERTTRVLKERLGDATADATCETLLVAADVGGDVDRRLRALAEDRRQDLIGRKEAAARQAGARLARWFVVIVPAGMAVAGLSVGEGRAAYRTPQGQVLVAGGIVLVVICWVWASRIMRLPDAQRVLDR